MKSRSWILRDINSFLYWYSNLEFTRHHYNTIKLVLILISFIYHHSINDSLSTHTTNGLVWIGIDMFLIEVYLIEIFKSIKLYYYAKYIALGPYIYRRSLKQSLMYTVHCTRVGQIHSKLEKYDWLEPDDQIESKQETN